MVIGVVNSILLSRRFMGIKKTELKAKQAELHLKLFEYMTDERFDEAFTDILWRWRWTDYDDYWNKYSPLKNPDANISRRLARNYYVSLATLVRRGLIDLDLVYQLNPSGATRYWDRMGPIAEEFRKRNDYPDYLEPVEYLANEMRLMREQRGVPHPKPITAD